MHKLCELADATQLNLVYQFQYTKGKSHSVIYLLLNKKNTTILLSICISKFSDKSWVFKIKKQKIIKNRKILRNIQN